MRTPNPKGEAPGAAPGAFRVFRVFRSLMFQSKAPFASIRVHSWFPSTKPTLHAKGTSMNIRIAFFLPTNSHTPRAPTFLQSFSSRVPNQRLPVRSLFQSPNTAPVPTLFHPSAVSTRVRVSSSRPPLISNTSPIRITPPSSPSHFSAMSPPSPLTLANPSYSSSTNPFRTTVASAMSPSVLVLPNTPLIKKTRLSNTDITVKPQNNFALTIVLNSLNKVADKLPICGNRVQHCQKSSYIVCTLIETLRLAFECSLEDACKLGSKLVGIHKGTAKAIVDQHPQLPLSNFPSCGNAKPLTSKRAKKQRVLTQISQETRDNV